MDYDMIEDRLIYLRTLCEKSGVEDAFDVGVWILYTRERYIPNTDLPGAAIKSWSHMLETANKLHASLQTKKKEI